MSDLIERQELIDEINRLVKETPNIKIGTSTFRDGILDAYARVLGIIRSVPSAHSNTSNTLGALDCIDRHKAINIRFSEGFDHDGILYVPWKDVKAHLKELPSVKPEFQEWQKIILSKLMVIRCKDCKNWVIGKTTKNYPNPYICDLHSFMHGFERSALPEDYCSWAELRGDSND